MSRTARGILALVIFAALLVTTFAMLVSFAKQAELRTATDAIAASSRESTDTAEFERLNPTQFPKSFLMYPGVRGISYVEGAPPEQTIVHLMEVRTRDKFWAVEEFYSNPQNTNGWVLAESADRGGGRYMIRMTKEESEAFLDILSDVSGATIGYRILIRDMSRATLPGQ